MKKINQISPELISKSSVETVVEALNNLEYLNTDWEKDESWEHLDGLVKYNNYGLFIKDKTEIIKELQSICYKYSLKALELNPNYQPKSFLSGFTSGIDSMCKALNIRPNQIGLNTLSVGYQNEEGNFTGYATSETNDENNVSNIITIKNKNVFAHEWLHFIDSSLGKYGQSISRLLDKLPTEDFLYHMDEFNSFYDFKNIIQSEDKSYSTIPINEAIKGAAHFLKRYAKDTNSFNTDLDIIINDFKVNTDNNLNSIEILKENIINLLESNYATRYFSFIEAQCQLYIDNKNNISLKKNQLIDFSKKADNILGGTNYTESTVEILARTFESFLFDKIAQNNDTCGILADNYNSDMYQQGNLKDKINNHWNQMWLEIKAGIDEVMPDTLVESKDLNIYKVCNNIQSMRKEVENHSNNTVKLN